MMEGIKIAKKTVLDIKAGGLLIVTNLFVILRIIFRWTGKQESVENTQLA